MEGALAMPRYGFWFNEHESIVWTMPRPPSVGDVVSFGDPRGTWKVTGRTDRDAMNVTANFAVAEATPDEGEPINDPLHHEEWAGRKYRPMLRDCPNCQRPVVAPTGRALPGVRPSQEHATDRPTG
jgi:hypothetical protein